MADTLALLAGIGFGVVIALAISSESRSLLSSPGGWFDALARFAALTGTYLMLIMIVLIARLPWLERTVGQDRHVKWHRRIGGWPIALIAVHVVAVTLGYAQMTKSGPLHQLWVFLRNYPDLLAATVSFALLIFAGISSAKIARRKMKYETWWVVHLYMYLALALAFAHQIVTGVMFLGHPLARAYWIAIWTLTAGVALTSRVLLPIVRNARLQLRVHSVIEETPGIYSVTIKGKQLSRLAVSGGQFFQWRFLTKGLWSHSHPYSLSALPRPPYLRVTVKASGDQSGAVRHLKPGTRVLIEGPYGTFTKHARTNQSVTMVGAGVGITPLRALLEDLPADIDVSVIIRASSAEDIVHRDEVAALVKSRGGSFHELVGSRHQVALDARTINRLAPRLAQGDLYICGPDGFTERFIDVAQRLGVRQQQIHHEAFSF
ncbi:MAG: ferredoxin reductase family protein [Acidimicrobiales bacterium]